MEDSPIGDASAGTGVDCLPGEDTAGHCWFLLVTVSPKGQLMDRAEKLVDGFYSLWLFSFL